MSEPSLPHLEALLAHSDWIRAVARRLVADPETADDLVQDTWLAALRRPPADGGDPRGWLRRVLTNALRQRRRGEGRRERREAERAPLDPAPSTEELAERAALEREVSGHVLALDEPFRAVILLRFYEGLEPPAVAERLGIPLKTVHSRQQRAFATLRARLDAEHGSRSSWCLALAPLIAPRESAPLVTTAAGALVVNTTWKIVAAALVLVLALGSWGLLSIGRTRGVAPAPEDVAALEPPRAVELTRAEPRATVERAPERTTDGAEVGVTVEPVPVATWTLRGRALTLAGEPLANVPVALSDRRSDSVHSAADGSFVLVVPVPTGPTREDRLQRCLRVVDEDWATLRESCVSVLNHEREHVVVAVRATRLAGHVHDASGVPIPEARVALAALHRATFAFPEPLDMTTSVPWRTETDAEGAFELERFPEAPGLSLVAHAPGFVARTVALDGEPRPLTLTLDAIAAEEGPWLTSFVVDHERFAVEDALVKLGNRSTRTASDGSFRLLVRDVQDDLPLVAAKASSLPALVPDFGRTLREGPEAPEPVELVLGGPPLEIRGRVVDEAGEPCVGWHVRIEDETEISRNVVPIESAEELAREERGPVTTDDRGAFVLTGLLPREYTLLALETGELHLARATVHAGDDVLLEADRSSLGPCSGRLVDRAGNGVADVRVTLRLVVSRSAIGIVATAGASRVTDEDGRFRFDDVPAREVYASWSGEDVLPGRFDLDPSRELQVEVVRRCHFRIELTDADADRAVFLDADGESLQVNQFQANGMSAWPFAILRDGRSDTLSVAEDAAEVELHRGDEVLGRHAVRLTPGEVAVLRF